MFKTKRDVDRHVSHILNRIREEKERNSRGYQFAKLYYDVADYESGKRYLQAFLSVRETVPQAHKLMGQILEAQKDKNKALESYKRSLDLDPEQKDVILKVCELYSDVNVNVSTDVAKVWIERAEKYFPNNHIVFKLKEKVVGIEGGEDNEELEHLISQELLKNPGDVKLHIKLLRLFIQSREVDRAYEHAITTEKTLAFASSIDWYECLADVYQVYQDQQGGGDETTLYVHKLVAMSTLTYLRLKSEDRDVVGAVRALHHLDEDLLKASSLKRHSSEWDSFLTEVKGQLFYLMGLLLLKRALKGQVSWKDSNSLATVCFLISDSLPAIDLKSSWYCQAKQDWKKFYERVYMTGCDRLSQGGHMIYALHSKQDGGQLSKKLRQLCTPQGKTSLYGLVFTGAELAKKKDESYFNQSELFTKTQLDMPSRKKLQQYDGVAYSLHSADLNHIVWLALQHYNLKDDVQPDYEHLFGYQLFHDMKYSVLDLSGGDPGTMCQLDVQVFLYLSIRWAILQNRDRKRNLHTIVDKPALMPACLSPPSCNKQQCEWWTAVNNMERKTGSEKVPRLWGVIMRGLETIRLVMPNALSLPLVVHVAKTLDARAHEIESLDAEGIVTPKLSAMQGRAAFYWTAASDMLDRKDRNISIRKPKDLLFPGDDIIDPAVVKDIREQVKFAMATVAMKQENYKEALSAFENLYKPEASHYTGLIYRKLAEDQDTNQNSSGNNQNSHQMALLSKSKTALYQALDRLETEQNEELKDAVRRDLDDVVCKLISLESGGDVVDSILSNTSQQYDTAGSGTDSEEEPIKHPSPSPRTPVLPLPSQSRDRMNLSPTKVEVQLRALEMVNSALSSRLSTLEETVKTNANFMHVQMQQLRDENKALKEQMQILSLQGLSGMSMIRAPGTPQQPSRMNPVNMSFGGASIYDFPGQNGLPPHMAQYGYSAASPRPGSAYGQPTYEDGFGHVDGEFYDPDHDNEFYNADQNLIQEWPFGHKAGVEGKSTITYSPQQQQQQQVRGLNPTSAGMFVNALRGPSIQYGAGYPSLVPQQPPSQLPGPGYFSQNSPQVQPSSLPTQAGMMQGQFGMASKPGTVPAMSPAMQPAMQPKPSPAQAASSKPAAPMMPPNAVIPSQTSEAKPLLIPGSVGIPAATTSAPGSTKSGTPSGVSAATQGQGQVQPGPASSILSSLAAKHQEGSSIVTPNVSTPQKTVFQGFSFTSTPKITEPKIEDKGKVQTPAATTEASTPKPFSGFSLTPSKPTVASAKSPGSDATKSTAGSQAAGSVLALGQNKSPSFGSLASQGQTAAAFQASGDQKGFAGAGLPVFGKTPPRRHNISTGSDDHTDEYEPNVDFKPVIQLPELIEVKTGEEEEEKMFCERAKLFRFDKDAEQWKERGIGDMKILRHRETKNVRILMRREQVLKLCANHKLTESMKLSQMSSSDRAWVWNATDFSEGETKHEKFAVKFKTVDIADKFKKAFEKCQAELPTTESEATVQTTAGKAETKDSESAEGKGDLASMFKPKVGSWTCNGCYVNNGSEIVKCPCCGSLKPGVKPEDVKKESGFSGFSGFGGSGFGAGSQTAGGFKFGSQPAAKTESAVVKTDTKSVQIKSAEGKGDLASMFKPKTGSWTCDGCYVNSDGEVLKCPCCGSLKPGVKPEDVKKQSGFGSFCGTGFYGSTQTGDGFKFGNQPSDASSTAETGSGFKFGSGTESADSKPMADSGFKFGTSSTTSASQPSTGFKFGTSTTTSASQPSTGFQFGNPTTASTPSSSIPFGVTPTEATSTTTSGFMFGSTATSVPPTSSIFGTPATTSSIFGTPATTSTTFGTQATTSTTFGTPATTSSIFGTPDTTSTTFGTPATTSTTFGTPATTSSIFGTPDTTSSIFGTPATTSSIFGTPATTSSIFGTPATTSSIFGTPVTTSSIFGTPVTTTSTVFGGNKDKAASGTIFGGNQSTSASKGFVFGGSTTETPDSTTEDVQDDKTEVEGQTAGAGESLLAKFLASPDSWTCNGCYVSNDGMIEKCPCCGTIRPENKAPSFTVSTLATAVPDVKPGTAVTDTKPKQGMESKAGFTFGKPAGNTDQKPEGFQFGSPQKTPTEGFRFTLAPTSEDEKPQPTASLGSGFNFSMTMTPLKKQSPAKQTAGASPNVMGVMSPKSPEITADGFYVNKEGDDSHIHFEPVIELPDHVEVKTGEENEEKIFSHRAKLFRFVNGEWKERGVGDVKVLYDSEMNKARIVMRREHILKLCCNHYVFPELNFKPMPSSQGRALVWFTMDFAEGEPKSEQFSIKFRSEEVAKKFESAVEEAKEKVAGTKVSKPKEKQDTKSESAAVMPTVAVETIGAVGGVPESVTDDASYDDGDDILITSVEEATEEEIRKARELMLPDHFYLYTRRPPCPGCRGCNDELPDFESIRGDADQSRNLSQTQEEGELDDDDDDDEDDDSDDDYEDEDDDDDDDDDDYEDDETNGEEKSTEAGGFVFGGGGSQFSFASLAAGGGASSFSADSSKPFQWQGAGRQLFGGRGGADNTGEGDEADVQQGEEQHFEPVVPLPELIEVKTGEEDETVEFSHRAKLFRFDKDANQWKEKGIGEMKILKHKETGKYRLLLRREQVHKLACNNLLTPDIQMSPMNTSETAWCWIAQDYSEGECRVEQLAVKFKTIELAKSFKAKVDEVQALQQQS